MSEATAVETHFITYTKFFSMEELQFLLAKEITKLHPDKLKNCKIKLDFLQKETNGLEVTVVEDKLPSPAVEKTP